MPFKSILRAVGRFVDALPSHGYLKGPVPPPPDLQRLTSRSDWPASVPEWKRPAPHLWEAGVLGVAASPPWPPTDDPYAKPEPCPVVPDPGLERVRKLTERGLIMPVGDKGTLSQIMELIDRQEDAEKHLRKIGMIWERGRGWYLP